MIRQSVLPLESRSGAYGVRRLEQRSGLDCRIPMGNPTDAGGIKVGGMLNTEPTSQSEDRRPSCFTLVSYPWQDVENRPSWPISNRESGACPYSLPPSTSHRLTSISGVVRTYDANGNLLTIGPGSTKVYDDRNRLTSSGGVNYNYNGRGERVVKSGAEGDIDFAYDESGRLLSEISPTPAGCIGEFCLHSMSPPEGLSAGSVEYFWMDGLPIGVSYDGYLYTVESDHLGTPRRVRDPSRNATIWSSPFQANPFGEAAVKEDPDGDLSQITYNLRFPGQYVDAESGINYNYFRDFEAKTGRYVESHPIGLDGGIASYEYVFSDPIGLVDSLGLKASICCRLLANAFFGNVLRQRHCYIRAEDTVFSLAPNGPDGQFVGVKQTDYDDDNKDVANPARSTKCKECRSLDCNDPTECLRKAFDDYPQHPGYFPIGKNSNTFAGTLFRACCSGDTSGLGSAPGIGRKPPKDKQ